MKIDKESVLVKPSDLEPSSPLFEILGTLNPAVFRADNGDIIMYVRVIEKVKKDKNDTHYFVPRFTGMHGYKLSLDKIPTDKVLEDNALDIVLDDNTKRLKFISHLRRVVLDSSGFKIKFVDQIPSFFGSEDDAELGVEDPRITKIDKTYYMTYVALSRADNVATNYATSSNGLDWQRKGLLFREQNKDAVFFPEKINNRFVALNRPEGNFHFSAPHMHIIYSPDGVFWGQEKKITLSTKAGWDAGRVGAGPPPLKTDKGWLLIYHGVIPSHYYLPHWVKKIMHKFNVEMEKLEYVMGLVLLDLNNPEKILARATRPALRPRSKHEKGTFERKDVFFPTAIVVDQDPRYILLYSGGGDVVTTVKRIALSELFKALKPV